MDGSGKQKNSRSKRKTRSRKPENSVKQLEIAENSVKQLEIAESNTEFAQTQCNNPDGYDDFANKNPIPKVNPNLDVNGCRNHTDEELEDLLLRKLEMIYNEAYGWLLADGHDRDLARRAILTNGHVFGDTDIMSNIVHTSLMYIKNNVLLDNGNYRKVQQVFGDFNQLARYSLSVMFHLLLQVRPQLNKGDAMRCLLVSNFHLGLARTMKIPLVPNEGNSEKSNSADAPSGFDKFPAEGNRDQDFGICGSSNFDSNGEKNNSVDAPSGFDKFSAEGNGDQDFEICGSFNFDSNGAFESRFEAELDSNVGLLKRFNLTPSLVSLLKKSIVNFAAVCRANMGMPPEQSQALSNSRASDELSKQYEWEDSQSVNLILGGFVNLNLDEEPDSKPVDQKIETISSLVCQIKALKAPVNKHKEWAHQKVLQAAKKLSCVLLELKMLKMESEGKQRTEGKLELEDDTLKRFQEMENALRDANCRADLATTAMTKLEKENSEIRSEVEAIKLSASESNQMCTEFAKKERKALKRLLALEKDNNKLNEDIEDKEKNIFQLQQQLLELRNAQEETEVNWKQEVKAKELTITKVQEDRRLKEEADISCKRKKDALNQKMEIDSQRHKDDMRRLEEEISHLQMSSDSTDLHHSPNVLFKGKSETKKADQDVIEEMLLDFNGLKFSEEEILCDRGCIICKVNEASVVFLPCAHQVLCVYCNRDYCNNVEAGCPCCQVLIVQRIRVYGASS